MFTKIFIMIFVLMPDIIHIFRESLQYVVFHKGDLTFLQGRMSKVNSLKPNRISFKVLLVFLSNLFAFNFDLILTSYLLPLSSFQVITSDWDCSLVFHNILVGLDFQPLCKHRSLLLNFGVALCLPSFFFFL